MDSFWVFLEAMAGIVDNREVVERLQQDLSEMLERKRDKMIEYLRIVSEEVSRLAAMADKRLS